MTQAKQCPVHQLRSELEALPERMRALPVDERGYVVPWFVDWIDGKPEFRAMDTEKWKRAVKEKRCWVCGRLLGRYLTFVAGPMCGINRTSSEPPCHLECAEWSARNCPFLNNPEQVRREGGVVEGGECIGFGLKRNPGVSMLWTCKDYSVYDDGRGGKLICMGEPSHVEWWAQGRPGTYEEVMASIDSDCQTLKRWRAKRRAALSTYKNVGNASSDGFQRNNVARGPRLRTAPGKRS